MKSILLKCQVYGSLLGFRICVAYNYRSGVTPLRPLRVPQVSKGLG
jgi:hypothetical protein